MSFLLPCEVQNCFMDHITQEAGYRIASPSNQQQDFLGCIGKVPTAALPPPPSYKFLFGFIGLWVHHTEADSHMLGRTGWGLVFLGTLDTCRCIFLGMGAYSPSLYHISRMEKPMSRLMSPYLEGAKMSDLRPIPEHLMKLLPL